MTDREEQRAHWAAEKKWLGAIFGILVTYGVGGIWWAASITDKVETVTVRQAEDRDRLTQTRAQVQSLRITEGRLEQRLTGLEGSAERQERLLEEIARELRTRQ